MGVDVFRARGCRGAQGKRILGSQVPDMIGNKRFCSWNVKRTCIQNENRTYIKHGGTLYGVCVVGVVMK
jgi:hypothetical protein